MDDAKRAAIEKFFSTDLRFMPRYNLYDFGNAEEKQKLKRDNEDLKVIGGKLKREKMLKEKLLRMDITHGDITPLTIKVDRRVFKPLGASLMCQGDFSCGKFAPKVKVNLLLPKVCSAWLLNLKLPIAHISLGSGGRAEGRCLKTLWPRLEMNEFHNLHVSCDKTA